MARNEDLKDWLSCVIDELAIYRSRAEWGVSLGVSEQAVGQWVAGRSMPRPDKLRSIVLLLRDRYSKLSEDDARDAKVDHSQLRSALDSWKRLSKRRPDEAWGNDTRTDAPTLGHYIVTPLWDELRLAIESNPTETQEELIERFITDTQLRRRRSRKRETAAADALPLDPSELMEGPMSEVFDEDPELASVVVRSNLDGTVWIH